MGSVLTEHQSDLGVSVVTLNRPNSLNALNEPMVEGLEAALRDCAGEAATTAVVIRGAGRAFCAGNDLHEQGVDAASRVLRMHALILRIHEFPKVVVAAINGVALGGGLELAMACTFRAAHVDARVGLPEIKMNLIPGFGGTQLLPRIVGRGAALRMLLSGEQLDGQGALDCGLVDSATEGDPTEAALALLACFPRADHLSRRAVLDAVRRGTELPLRDALDVERELVREVAAANASSALRAFRQGVRF